MPDRNFASGTIWTGDCLEIMRGMNDGTVDLIYLDPPFNSNRTYEAPIGSRAAGAAFKDTWTLDDVDVCEHGELADRHPAAAAVIDAARQAHGPEMQSYLIMMAVRLLEMQRVLAPTGSLYLHCDPTADSYLRLLLDAIFGRRQFRNEIVWCYHAGGASKRYFPRKHDVILLYGKDSSQSFHRPIRGVPYRDIYAYDKVGATQVQKGYHPEGKMISDWWEISLISSVAKERLGYPTQKPLKLLERIIQASSNEGDLVLDPFVGCATTLVAADRLGRQWAGIDLSPLAIRLVNERIASDRGPLWGGATARTDPPQRTDLGDLPNYRTHRHRLYGVQEGVCAGCATHFPFRVMDVDHILPRSRGGTDHPDNLQLLCSGCNRSKGGRTMAEWRAARSG